MFFLSNAGNILLTSATHYQLHIRQYIRPKHNLKRAKTCGQRKKNECARNDSGVTKRDKIKNEDIAGSVKVDQKSIHI